MARSSAFLSSEEENELVRSNKKVKEVHHASYGCASNLHGETVSSPKVSFREKLVGEMPGVYAQTFDFSEHMDADSDSDDESSEIREGFATIRLSKETKQRIRAPWAKALIIKVFGRIVGFSYLHSRIMGLWKPSGRLDMMDLGKDYFLVRFSNQEDLEVVLKRGPWFIGGHFLSIRRWEANFKPSEARVSSVAVWVRLNELPIEYYDAIVLRQIGEALGNVLRIDTHTATETRGRYARLCVQIDSCKPLVTTVRIGDRCQAVVYEGVSNLCFSCGRIGHRREVCQYSIKQPIPPARSDTEERTVDDANGAGTSPPEAGRSPPLQTEARGLADDPDEAAFGPWMVVSRKRKGPKTNKKSVGNLITASSRDSMQVSQKETLKTGGVDRDPAEPSNAKNSEGKRKSRAELDSNEITEGDVKGKPNSGTKPNNPNQVEFCISGPLGLFSRGPDQMKSGVASVRGKKDIARNKASINSPKCAASKKDGLSDKADWEATISKLQADSNGGFKFGSKEGSEVGNQQRGAECGDMGQQHSSKGGGESLSAGSDDYEDGLSSPEPMVEPSCKRMVDSHQDYDGDGSTLWDADAELCLNRRADEEDRMDFDGGRETLPSV